MKQTHPLLCKSPFHLSHLSFVDSPSFLNQKWYLSNDGVRPPQSSKASAGSGQIPSCHPFGQAPQPWTCRVWNTAGKWPPPPLVLPSAFPYGTFGNQMCILMLLQVVHMQCNVEPVEEGTKFHVSFISITLLSQSPLMPEHLPPSSEFCVSHVLAHIAAETGG